MNVLRAAWSGAGFPALQAPTRSGRCARCSGSGEVVATRAIISKTFSGFDDWAQPNGFGICEVCAWGHATAQLRLSAHLVTRTPAMLQALERADAHSVLLAGPMDSGRALIVPLRPGRKHLLPSASWGRVTVDNAKLPWGAGDVARLHHLTDLRGRGFGSRMLTEPVPPFTVLRTLPREQWEATMHAWRQLDPWRSPDNPWLPLAVHLTTSATPRTATKETLRR